jgi:hypothetical protein
MADPNTAAGAAQGLGQVQDGLRRMPEAIDQLSGLVPLLQIIPVADLLFGGAMLLLICAVHASGISLINAHFSHRSKTLTLRPVLWRTEVLLGVTIFAFLGMHLVEIVLWAAGLHYSKLVPDWRLAGLFAARNYTALGSDQTLPIGWGMLAPIIAISGLFTFGWTGSVLVGLVSRYHQLRDLSRS